jgi:hypothetical protein
MRWRRLVAPPSACARGVAINPDVIKAQMEGGIGFGLGAVLYGGSMLMALPRAVVPIRHRDPKQAAHRAYLQRGNFGV